ncbi:MAG: helix-turn-helix domain-containing protein [Nitrosomonadaceae bacterium]|jgi:Fis family transcriptional regulator|nr:Fis family transcriptional regulator [Nitrosospira sp.]MDW7565046.1 helix-turn-helix domain-containing protein [Nitrosomonadaceae bacterium]MBI0408545.1 Fis family transcriptional regulator [Nitrosospira sp.]MBI0410189.1 Fis family transcriptional regulator [Nitrosospira sp.]MBI0412412.1 Fis family transcriptional regulator [Nitrosospira sp.]
MIKENDIAYCVRKSVESYLKDLDGERPHPLHDMVISSVEKPLIQMILKYAGGNQTRAAELLGIHRNTLRSKMKYHQIN